MNFFKSKMFISLVILVFIAGCVSAMAASSKRADITQNIVGVFITPLQSVLTNTRNSIDGFFSYFTDFERLKKENEDLKQKVKEQSGEKLDFEKYKQENERLLGLLNLKQARSQLNVEVARVVGREPGNWSTGFVIDKGTLSGVEKKSAVITKDGLVGFVTEVGSTWSKVSTILERETSIGGIVVTTSDVGIVEGSLELMKDGKCKMSYLSRNAKINVGDHVETSGFGQTYPRGIVIGEIVKTVVESHGISQYAIIKPLVEFNALKEVMVVKSFNEG